MKEEVKLIAPELTPYIDGVDQIARIRVTVEDNILTVDGKEYIGTGDNPLEVQGNIVDLINGDPDAVIRVVNVQAEYFDVACADPVVISTPAGTEIIQTAVPAALYNLLESDVEYIVNEKTFTCQVDRARRYLMAHLLTWHTDASSRFQGAVSSESVGQVSVTYADPLSQDGLALTGYGSIYRSIYLQCRRIRFV